MPENMKQLSLFALALVLLCACHHRQADVQKRALAYDPQWAEGFQIDSIDGGLLFTVSNPWQGAHNVSRQLTVTHKARRIVAMSSTHIALLDAIGMIDKVVGVSGMRYVSNKKLKAVDVGYEGNVDYERIVALKPDLVLLYSTNSASTMEKKLSELGIAYLYVGDYLEQSPLGKAEWMIALGYLTGAEQAAKRRMSAIATRYTALRDSIAALHLPRPRVMMNMPYSDAWFMPSKKSYAVRLINDAGGQLVYNQDTGNESQTIGMEQAFLLASEADIWLNPGTVRSMKELTSALPRFAGVKSVKSGEVWNNNRRTTPAGGNDYYESGIVNPDIVLDELIRIFHQHGQGEMKYHRKIKN